MQPGGQDNYPLVQTLMNTISPLSGNVGTMEVVVPAVVGQVHTYYYFSKPFVLSRNMNLNCNGSNEGGDAPVVLLFPPGVDGVIQESGYLSPDGGWGQSIVRGCQIASLGAGLANATPGTNVVANLVLNPRAADGPIPASCSPSNGSCTVGVGDGVVIMGIWIPVSPAVDPGAYVATSDHGNPGSFTLASGYTIKPTTSGATNMEVWDLPASLKYTIQTTIGSNTMIVTAGPKPLAEGDMLWSEAFLFGSSVYTTDGNTFPQTVTVNDVTLTAHHLANAVAAHTSGSPGQMWTIPEGLKRRVTGSSYNTVIEYFGFGLDKICQSRDGPVSTGCDNTIDEHNYYWFNLVGRFTRGDNTTNGTVMATSARTTRLQIRLRRGRLAVPMSVKSTIAKMAARPALACSCGVTHKTIRTSSAPICRAKKSGPCMGNDAQGNPNIGVAASITSVPSQLFIGSTYGYAAISSQLFAGRWSFAGGDGVTGAATVVAAAGQNVLPGVSGTVQSLYRGMNIADLTNPVIPTARP